MTIITNIYFRPFSSKIKIRNIKRRTVFKEKNFEYPLNENYKEIWILKAALQEAGIPFSFHRLYDGWQLCYPKDGEERICSIVQHYFSYGHEFNLLEILGLNTETEEKEGVGGFLSAVEVFHRIKNNYEGKENDKS